MATGMYDSLFGGASTNLSRTKREVDNARTRLRAIGYGQEAEPENSESFLSKVFGFLERFERGAGGAAGELLAPSLSSTPQFDPLSAFGRGFRGVESIKPRDIAVHRGVSEEPLFETTLFDKFKVSPSPAGIAGFLGSVLNPLDPVNWLTFGVGSAAAKGMSRGTPLLQKAFGDDTAKTIAETLGKRAEGVTGESVGDLVGSLLKKADESLRLQRIAPEDYDNFRKLLETELGRVGAKKKLPTGDKHLTAGLSVPIINAKVAQAAIPGSKPIVTNLSRMGEKFMQTPMGTSLGKAFDTGFISSRPTNSIMRMLDGDEMQILTAGEAGKNFQKIVRGMDDLSRSDLEENIKAVRADFEGIPLSRRKELTRELSMEGRFTDLFETKPKTEAIEDIKKLGFTDNEAFASLRFHNLRRDMEKWYTQEGIRDTWLPAWVPNMFLRPPSKTEAGVLKLKYGSAVDQLVPHSDVGSFNDSLFEMASKKNPFLKDREVTSGALSPQEVNEYLVSKGMKPLLEEDLYNIIATVQERFIRSQQAVNAVKMLRNEYGMDVGRLRNAGQTFVPEGYGLYRVKTSDKSGRVSIEKVGAEEETSFLRELATGKKGEADNSQTFALPVEMADAWESYTKLHTNPVERNSFLRFIDNATSQFRTLAYMVTPGHVPRDFMSNLYNLWLMGTRNVSGIPESFRLASVLDRHIIFPTSTGLPDLPRQGWTYVDNAFNPLASKEGAVAIIQNDALPHVSEVLGKTVKVGGRDVPYLEVMRQASAKGVIDTGWWSLEGPRTGALRLEPWRNPDGSINKAKLKQFATIDPQKWWYTGKMVTVTKLTDNSSRILGFLDRLKKGDSFEDAAAKVKTYLFDYGDLTPFERTWMRRVFPFYTWMRKNIPLQIKEAFKQPGKLATVGKYHRGLSEEQDPGQVPSFLEESEAMKLPGGEMFLSSPLPYQDLSRLPMDWRTLSEMLSNINPIFRTPVELAMNKKFFSNTPIESYEGEKAEGLPGEAGLDKRGLAYLLENIPLYRNVATMSPAVPGYGILAELLAQLGMDVGAEGTDEERALARMMSFLGGPQLFSAQRAGEISTYEERDRLRALIRLLGDSGITVPDVRSLR